MLFLPVVLQEKGALIHGSLSAIENGIIREHWDEVFEEVVLDRIQFPIYRDEPTRFAEIPEPLSRVKRVRHRHRGRFGNIVSNHFPNISPVDQSSERRVPGEF